MNVRILSILILSVSIAACQGNGGGKSRGPIVLGDSSTIVTEENAAMLQDQVTDLKPVIASTEDAAPPGEDTARTQASANPAIQTNTVMNGLVVSFKDVTINIPGITTRSYGKPDLQKARGATYELTAGNLPGAQLHITGGTPTMVTQRYQTMLMLKDGSEKLVLESLPKQTSDWETLNGSGGVYSITGLGGNELEYKLPSANALRNAVQQAARRAHLNRADTQDWLESVRNIRSANQAPATVMLRSVMWRVEGKGFSKELRVDVPLP